MNILFTELSVGTFFSEASSFPAFITNVPTVVWCVFAGVLFATAAALYNKRMLGSFVRFLIKSGASDAETAIRLSDTAYAKNILIRSALAHNYTFHKYIYYTDGQQPEEENTADQAQEDAAGKAASPGMKKSPRKEKTDKKTILSRRYYIPADKAYAAETLYSQKGSNPVTVVILIVVLLIVAFACLKIIPYLMELVNDLIQGFSA